MTAIFIIEHLEPELGEWCLIEYEHISELVGKGSLWFTNVKDKKGQKILAKYGKVYEKSIKDIKLENACILDPESQITLTPENSKKFSYFIFGGILGDYPPRKRTKNELTKFVPDLPAFNIGSSQMSTDNAVYVTKKIIEGTPIETIQFKENIEIKINKIESTILPYKYALVKGKPLMSPKLLSYLKKH